MHPDDEKTVPPAQPVQPKPVEPKPPVPKKDEDDEADPDPTNPGVKVDVKVERRTVDEGDYGE